MEYADILKNHSAVNKVSVNIFTLVCKVFKEIKIRIMLMLHSVSTGQTHHCSCKFPIFTEFVRETGSIKYMPYFLIVHAIAS